MLNHIGIYTENLEQMESFFRTYCGLCESYEPYENPRTRFKSVKLRFNDGTVLELMNKPGLAAPGAIDSTFGLAHISISLPSREAVDDMAQQLANDGYRVVDGPRMTGDGYYELKAYGPSGLVIEFVQTKEAGS